jgi:hypothetical protein
MEKLFLTLVLLGFLTGCAAPAKIENMSVNTISKLPTDSILRSSIGQVDVTGGSDTNPMWVSKVSSIAFQRALEESLKAAGLWSTLGPGSRYQLTADLLSLDQPAFGLDLKVTANVSYRLIERKSRKEVFSKTIKKSHTASFSDSFLANERLQIANEGAIKANIFDLIHDLQQVKE